MLDAVVNDINATANSQKLTRDELRGMISVEAVNETQLVKVTVTSTNADYACLIATAFGNAAPQEIIRITKAGSVELVDHAEVAKTPSSPRKSMFALVGAVVGAAGAILFFVIKMLTDIGNVEQTGRKWKMNGGGVIVNEQTRNANAQN